MANLSMQDEETASGGALVPFEEREEPQSTANTVGRRSSAGYMRLLLPLAALMLVAAVFAFASRGRIEAPEGLSIDGVAIGDGLEVTNPRFVGETEDGSPFRLTAKSARPDGPDPEKIALTAVAGNVGLPDGKRLNATAKDGMFQPKRNTLDLSGDVVAKSSDGYTLSSETMSFDLATRTGRTKTPVRLEGPMGELTAKSMEAQFDQDFVATFSGGVKIIIRRLTPPEEP